MTKSQPETATETLEQTSTDETITSEPAPTPEKPKLQSIVKLSLKATIPSDSHDLGSIARINAAAQAGVAQLAAALGIDPATIEVSAVPTRIRS